MTEEWDLVDINKQKTGITHERGKEDSIPFGMYHLVVEIWTKNSNGEILLTQRHPNKNYGLFWECSGGSVVKGESCIFAAQRELFEETGINADINELIYLGDTIKSNYIVETYLYNLKEKECILKLQEEEVVDSMWIKKKIMQDKKEFIVDGVWDRFLEFKEKI